MSDIRLGAVPRGRISVTSIRIMYLALGPLLTENLRLEVEVMISFLSYVFHFNVFNKNLIVLGQEMQVVE